MKENINETTKLKEPIEAEIQNKIQNQNQQNIEKNESTLEKTSNENSSQIYNDPQYRALLNHFGGQIPRLRPELRELKEQVLHFGMI